MSGTNLCYQTNYTDAHYQEIGYTSGFCPFQLVDSLETVEICNNSSQTNIAYCPDTRINITIFKMGKA